MKTDIKSIGSKNYRPGSPIHWYGRSDGFGAERFHEKVQCIDLRRGFPEKDYTGSWAFVGFSSDEGVKRIEGREGAALGPSALRHALGPLVAPSNIPMYDIGDIVCDKEEMELAQHDLGETITLLLSMGIRPVVLGGSHELSLGAYLGVSAVTPSKDYVLINFDSRTDLGPLLKGGKGSSETAFMQIANNRISKNLDFDYTCIGVQKLETTPAMLEKAKELKAYILYADEFHIGGNEASIEIVNESISRADVIHLSISLDVFAAPFAPGVSNPHPFGIFPRDILPTIRKLASTNKVICFEIAELCPPLDKDNITARLGADLIAEFFNYLPPKKA